MVGSTNKVSAMLFIFMICMLMVLPPIYACGYCPSPHPPSHHHPSPSRPHPPTIPRPQPPTTPRPQPPHRGGAPKVSPPTFNPPIILPPPIINPPVITPPIRNPPVIPPPPSSTYPPYPSPPCKGCGGGGGGGGGGTPGLTPPTAMPKCPINALKLGLCVDVLGGLVHIGLGDPVENVCCSVLKGLLELEAAICLCTTIRLKLLNLNIFIPLALQALITCGITPPPGFVCPPLV